MVREKRAWNGRSSEKNFSEFLFLFYFIPPTSKFFQDSSFLSEGFQLNRNASIVVGKFPEILGKSLLRADALKRIMKFRKLCCYSDFEERIVQPLLQVIQLCLIILTMLLLIKTVYG